MYHNPNFSPRTNRRIRRLIRLGATLIIVSVMHGHAVFGVHFDGGSRSFVVDARHHAQSDGRVHATGR